MRTVLPMFALVLAASIPALARAQPVSLPPFDAIELHGGGDVEIVPGPVQRVTILSGSTQFTSFRLRPSAKLEIDACNARCPTNYPLRIRIESPRVPTLAVQAGGTIVVRPGFAPQNQAVAAVSAGGTIDMRALQTEASVTAVNAGGDIYVRTRSSLTAAISSGGRVHYAGHPNVEMAVHDGGDVVRDD
ncbi:DUF2807 domain-containing protein [Sphingomonas sp.]|uniref:GIN domain-containing protein n=1 Tax=Sphingomonas sp. TaxID=28214 RepID=UPI0025CF0F89|nr:DUF2807 domain-containing protein [Sphingomonas sp.]MBV9527060.1 DUF2807 domain-containing protein [Sphingomonas sp.]